MRYPGGKGAAGARERILSLMPRHTRYIEPYFGGGAVFYAKRPAFCSIVSDVDADLIRYHQQQTPMPATEYRTGCALELIRALELVPTDLLYLDPPYLPEVRRDLALYHHETDTAHHRELLALIVTLPCFVMLSGYRSDLYDAALPDWHREDYQTMTRRGPVIESCWCNFQPGGVLHDPRYAGANFRERERIKRKTGRWVARLRSMPPTERAVIAEALQVVELAEAIIVANAAARSSSEPASRSRTAETGEAGQRIVALGEPIASLAVAIVDGAAV